MFKLATLPYLLKGADITNLRLWGYNIGFPVTKQKVDGVLDSSTEVQQVLPKPSPDYSPRGSVGEMRQQIDAIDDVVGRIRKKYKNTKGSIDELISTLEKDTPMISLNALLALEKRLDIFTAQSPTERWKDSVTIYSPPTEEVYNFFRDSPYKEAEQSMLILLRRHRELLNQIDISTRQQQSGLMDLSRSSDFIESKNLAELQDKIADILSPFSKDNLYKRYFGKLDQDVVISMARWGMFHPTVQSIVKEYFTDGYVPEKLSKMGEKLVLLNMLHRYRARSYPSYMGTSE